MANNRKTTICVSIDSELLEKLKEHAKQENRTVSNMVEVIIKDFLIGNTGGMKYESI